jgi:hypothetical protein
MQANGTSFELIIHSSQLIDWDEIKDLNTKIMNLAKLLNKLLVHQKV